MNPDQHAENGRGLVHDLRVRLPGFCCRPAPEWDRVCILDLGHDGMCGWQYTNGKRMGWERQIDGEA